MLTTVKNMTSRMNLLTHDKGFDTALCSVVGKLQSAIFQIKVAVPESVQCLFQSILGAFAKTFEAYLAGMDVYSHLSKISK